jgi:hypothetical protein
VSERRRAQQRDDLALERQAIGVAVVAGMHVADDAAAIDDVEARA